MDDTFLLPGERLDEVNERLCLIQKPQGLTFGTDALLLAAFVRPAPTAQALELGGGSGIVSLLLCAREKCRTVLCAEIQPDYVDLIRRNVLCNRMQDRIFPCQADVRQDAAFTAGGFDLVFTNPPYLPVGSGPENVNDGKNIARREVAGSIADFARAAGRALRYGGAFYCVYLPERLTDLLAALRSAGIEPKRLRTVHPTPAAAPVLLLLEGRRGGRPGLRFEAPFVLSDKGSNTPAMEALLQSGQM